MSTQCEGKKSPLYFHRENMEKILDRMENYPIIAITAPMGYGKTVLIKNYLLGQVTPVCWLALNRADNAVKYFWDKLIRAFGRIGSDVGKLIDMGFPDTDEKIAAFFSAFMESGFSCRERYMVFDDYQYIHNPKIHELLQYIAQERFDGLHVILITRSGIPENFMEMEINHMMGVIGMAAFEFSPEDIQEFFHFNCVEITPEQARLVRRNTGGWITAIYLVMLSYQQDGQLDQIPSDLEKLVETTMYRNYDEKTREILLKLSISDSFTQESAVYITGEPDAGQYVDALVAQNSFIRYNPKTNAYLFHPVLHSFLYRTLLAERGNELETLMKRAAEYLMAHESYVSGLHMFHKIGDYERIAAFLKDRPFSLWNQLEIGELIQFFTDMPRIVKQNYFVTYLRFLLFLALHNQFEQAQQMIKDAWDIYRNSWMSGADQQGRLQGEILMVEAVCHTFHPNAMLHCLRQADALLPRGSLLTGKKAIVSVECIGLLTIAHEKTGCLKEEKDTCVEISGRLFRLTGGLYGTGGDALCQGEYQYLRGELQESESQFFLALHQAQSHGNVLIALRCIYFLIQVLVTDGDFDKINRLMELQQQTIGENREYEMLYLYDMFRAKTYAALGDQGTLTLWSSTEEVLGHSLGEVELAWKYLSTASVSVVLQRWGEVSRLCVKMKVYFTKNQKVLGQIYTNIFEAIATLKLYTEEFAKVYLRTALQLAEKDGMVMPFVEFAEYILKLLQCLRGEKGADTGFLDRIIAMCHQRIKGLGVIRKKMFPQKLNIEFTPREKELIRCLINCESNKEIAYDMGVKIGTVKKMMYNVFQKLQVNCRAGAVKKIMNCNIEL